MATRTYLLPQVIVQQDFASLPASATQDLLAVIVGPKKSIRDIADTNDAEYVSYGALDAETDTTYVLKGIETFDVVEKDSINVELKNFSAEYASLSGTGDVLAYDTTIYLTDGSFIESPTSTRNAAFNNRDVQIGDGVIVTDSVDTVVTKIIGFERSQEGAGAGATISDAANQIFTASATITASGNTNSHTSSANASAFRNKDALALGYTKDTYTVVCTTGGFGAAASFTYTSELGDDGIVTAAALGNPINIGSWGLTLTLGGTGNYVDGETYVIVAQGPFANKQPAIGGGTFPSDYTGTADTTYEIRVIRGGAWDAAIPPQVLVTTTNGVDYAAAQSITSKDQVFLLGSLGLKAAFPSVNTNEGLRLGDVFYVPITAAVEGPANKAIVADNIPWTDSDNVTVRFMYNGSSVSVPRAGYPTTGDVAWTISEDGTSITLVSSDLYISDEAFTDSPSGDLLRMKVYSGSVYVGYSAIKTDGSNELNSISEPSLIETQIGKIVPGNPLSYGVYKALQNSAGVRVMYVSISEDSLDGYIQAFDATTYDPAAYYIVPMTSDAQIIQAVKAHVLSASDDSKARERVAVVNQAFSTTVVKYGTKSDNTQWTGYVVVNPDVPGQYDRVTIPGATLLTDGIRAGDYLRSNFSVDSLGNETYESVQILAVTGEETMTLVAPGFSAAVGSPADEIYKRMQVVHPMSRNEQAQSVAASSEALGSRRVVNVWPDVLNDGNTAVAGYFGAAAIAGLKSGVAPHQPLTNVTLTGFTGASRSTPYFTMDQLNTIAGGGTWIINQAIVGSGSPAQIYNRHQLTTDYTDDNMAEISITTNLDSISKIIREDLKAFIGQYNNHPYFMQLLKTRLVDRLTFLQGNTITLKAGPQLLGFNIVSLTADPNIRTRILATIDLTLPYPVNVIQIKLNVI